MLGEITFETEEFGVLPWIVLVFTCIFLPVILINFLIAKISNKYTESQTQIIRIFIHTGP